MRELYFIYNKTTGLIDGGMGKVDRSSTPDGSTMNERIPVIVAKDPDRAVLFMPFNSMWMQLGVDKIKIVDGKPMLKTEQEFEVMQITKDKAELEDRLTQLDTKLQSAKRLGLTKMETVLTAEITIVQVEYDKL